MNVRQARLMMEENSSGYMVHFDRIKGNSILESDYFPDKHAGEKLIETEGKAWELAKEFASKTIGRTCNIYVVSSDFQPVPDYESRKIKNR